MIYLRSEDAITVDSGAPGQTFSVEVRPNISGANNYHIVNNGTGLLAFGSINSNPSANATLVFDGSGDIRVTKLIRRFANQTTNLGLVKNGTGTLTILEPDTRDGNARGDATSYGYPTGTTTINQGTISINAEGNLGGNPGGYWTYVGGEDIFVPGAFNPAALLLNGGTLRATASFAIDDSNRGVTLGANGGTFEVVDSHTLTVANPITGPGALAKTGTGTLVLNAANTGFTGTTTVSQGTLTLAHGDALGGAEPGSGTIVANAARLQVQGGVTVAEPISITGNGTDGYSGALKSISGTNTWSGPISIAGSGARISIGHGGTFHLTGGITGSGYASFCGWNAGTIAVSDQPINLGNADLLAIDKTTLLLNVADNSWRNTRIAYEGVLKLGVANAMPTATVVTLGATNNGNGILDLNGYSQTVAGLTTEGTGNQRVVNSSGGTPTLTVNNSASLAFGGVLGNTDQDSFHFVKNGAGTLTLAGNNTYTGTTTVDQGTLLINGSTHASSTVAVNSGAVLGGTGTIGGATIVANGGILAVGEGIGSLTLENALTLEDGAIWNWEFLTNSLGEYDRAIGASNASLVLPDAGGHIAINIMGLPGYSILAGDSFTLFDGAVYADSALVAPGQDITHLFQITDNIGWWGTWELTGGSLILTAVPEPGTFLLVILGLLVGSGVRRRPARQSR